MYYHLILTDECNLCCTYCRGKLFTTEPTEPPRVVIDNDLPIDLAVDLDDLYAFLRKDPEAAVTFYGGEPLLRLDLIRKIAADAPVGAFLLHTNGMLLDRVEPALAARFETILVSVDGPPAITDANRGEGVFARVTENLQNLVRGGYPGEVIARMTVTEETDIDAAVRYLSDNEHFSFSSIHWQMDADFWDDYHQRRFAAWAETSYNPGIRSLIRRWVAAMRDEGRVLRWYPFLDTMQDLLLDRPSLLRCGCGHGNYSIMTDGSIAPCPIMVGMREYYLGHITTTSPGDLRKVSVGNPCMECSIRDFCGGRCLYANITKPWPDEGREAVCATVRNLHAALTKALPEVRQLIRAGRIALADFDHPKFNSCEIIP
ncbi:TIGR04084 family radical SAM/SPASM domain-containing protein [Methanoculleus sp. FWC-SCC1]|uniref:TIGR04084 family radical SAM/SPASM domain-containing protein n=1 Tax=Methanoculleus frigidifontis TaxID=2584085 RepID=A0ABT8M9M1_9EURY|nr:TIGR04084 family radical SAM/SPASM domain-containing protein [Methanoculleus sp. FWC-SCC1]MDN7024628.1 TIGR04084 family radical SAM/SPASM domain-containing protein [Methanoculleus sp. FWC-SCC1]